MASKKLLVHKVSKKIKLCGAARTKQQTLESEFFDHLNCVQFFDVIGIFAKFSQSQVIINLSLLLMPSILDAFL